MTVQDLNSEFTEVYSMLKAFTPRLYQETILSTCVGKNTMVVLPTGLGKTAVGMMLAAHRLKQLPNSKILFLAPTKPLAEQHLQSFKTNFNIDQEKMALFTGNVTPAKRESMWSDVQVIFSTPQGVENDIISNRIDLSNVSLLIFDEAHRATGDYSYVFIAEQYVKRANFPKILALTASPGSDMMKIEEVCGNLKIEEVEVRSPEDEDVKPYVQETEFQQIKVDVPEEFKAIQADLKLVMKTKLNEVKRYGMTSTISLVTKTDFLRLQRALQVKMAQGERSFEVLRSISLVAEAIKAHHALELLETQCIDSLHQYFEKSFKEGAAGKSKAAKNLSEDLDFKRAYVKVKSLHERGIDHPKLNVLREIVRETIQNNKFAKMIIFTQYRDTAVKIKQELDKINVLSGVFVGQAKKKTTGLSQKQQIEMLDEFRDGMFNVLIATSVAEEGLDVPNVDSVLFYEPVPSAIRTIQRRGRTGRHDKGKVQVLVAKGTRDEAFVWIAKAKEKQMHKVLSDLKTKVNTKLRTQSQPTLQRYVKEEEKLIIFADYREKGSGVVKDLVNSNVEVRLEMLNSADFVLSSRAGVEFKNAEDFVQSIIDGRLLAQLKDLKNNFERPIIIIEGTEDLYAIRNIHPNAIRGMLATIAISYGIPVLRTKDAQDTAQQLIAIAKREQTEENGKSFSPHADRKPLTLKEQQEYIISALPNVGMNLAKELLKKFGSVKNIINASEDELKQVDKLGDKKAKGIKEVSDSEYS
jgi:Fanconi anemia group M protein